MRRSGIGLAMVGGLLLMPWLVTAAEEASSGQQLGDQLAMENPEGGGSIRAKIEPDTAAQTRKADKRNIQVRVKSVKRATFPNVALLATVTKVAEDGPNKDKVKKDDVIIITGMLKMAGKNVDFTDHETVLNAGAYYLTDGDNVVVRLDSLSGKVWKAAYIERR